MYSTNCSIHVHVFHGNSASKKGGAIYAEWNSLITLTSLQNFPQNSAQYGGALAISHTSKQWYKFMRLTLYLHFHITYIVFCYLVEPPEVIDSRDLEYPDRQYRVDNLEMPEPILSSDGAKVKFSKGDSSPDGLLKTSPNKSCKLHNLFSCPPSVHHQ